LHVLIAFVAARGLAAVGQPLGKKGFSLDALLPEPFSHFALYLLGNRFRGGAHDLASPMRLSPAST